MSGGPSSSAGVAAVQALQVRPHEDRWALFADDVSVPVWVVSSRRQALSAARRDARQVGATLSVVDRKGQSTTVRPA